MRREDFIALVGNEQKQLRRFLLALCCGNKDEADDIAQESLIKAYLSSGSYREEGKFTAWLYKIAHHTFLDHRKNMKYTEDIEAANTLTDGSFAADRSFEYQELYAAIATLPPKERTSILLFYLKGYSVKEIAGIIDCNADAVKKQLSRGREQLKSKMNR